MSSKILNIEATQEGFCEYEADKLLIFVPKEEINKIYPGFGQATRWPYLSIIVGLSLIAIGSIFGVLPIVKAFVADRPPGGSILKGYGLISLHIVFGIYISLQSLMDS